MTHHSIVLQGYDLEFHMDVIISAILLISYWLLIICMDQACKWKMQGNNSSNNTSLRQLQGILPRTYFHNISCMITRLLAVRPIISLAYNHHNTIRTLYNKSLNRRISPRPDFHMKKTPFVGQCIPIHKLLRLKDRPRFSDRRTVEPPVPHQVLVFS